MLNIEKIKVLSTGGTSYEFVFEIKNAKYRGIDDKFNYPSKSLLIEFYNLIDNTLYSNTLFNVWPIKLFKDITGDNSIIKKSPTTYLTLILENDLKGNIKFTIKDIDELIYYSRIEKIKDFENFILNFSEFAAQPFEKYNSYSIDTFFGTQSFENF